MLQAPVISARAWKRSTYRFTPELVILLGAALAFICFPYDLGFLTRTLIMMILVLSLDLILGYAGIASLGHAAMYGTGAYAAGLFAIHVTQEPVLGLFAGGAAGALAAWASGLLLLRTHGLAFLMLSIAVAAVLQDLASKVRSVTGGADGLTGITMGPVLGMFEFDLPGRTGFWYACAVLLIVTLSLQTTVNSAFGLALRGIKNSPTRMRAIGTPVYRRLVSAYVIAGAVAGIAGALSAQITALVSIESYSFSLSAEIMVMLILGGSGRLYGAILGTLIFAVIQHVAAAIDPFNWLFVIGVLLLTVVFFAPEGLLSVPIRLIRLARGSS
ncbi:MAG: branched-chain amino acid ABC transporter permease [Proteobacteria bacterium]|nr:branched-chain amino acid ABC transporter permease [Pseudomonadota bacterium]MBI3497286.1 branched-chain amino acid ABC transporter permease [Pseudomonadota bacterium]